MHFLSTILKVLLKCVHYIICEIIFFCHHCSNSEVIGSGNFSLVSKGEWSTPSGPCMVAIKHASGNNATLRMLQEAVIMVQLWHPNVVNLLGLLEPQKSVRVHLTYLALAVVRYW